MNKKLIFLIFCAVLMAEGSSMQPAKKKKGPISSGNQAKINEWYDKYKKPVSARVPKYKTPDIDTSIGDSQHRPAHLKLLRSSSLLSDDLHKVFETYNKEDYVAYGTDGKEIGSDKKTAPIFSDSLGRCRFYELQDLQGQIEEYTLLADDIKDIFKNLKIDPLVFERSIIERSIKSLMEGDVSSKETLILQYKKIRELYSLLKLFNLRLEAYSAPVYSSFAYSAPVYSSSAYSSSAYSAPVCSLADFKKDVQQDLIRISKLICCFLNIEIEKFIDNFERERFDARKKEELFLKWLGDFNLQEKVDA